MVACGRERRHGLTMVDLLVAMFIVCLLTGVVFSAGGLVRARETANRVRCASNLRQIGQAILLYANENRGAYPRTVYKPGDAATQYTGVECKSPFDKDGPKANDVTAPLFLLVRTQDITPDVMICPSTDYAAVKFEGAKSAQDYGNFKSGETLTYSFVNAYPDNKAIERGYKVNITLGAEFAAAADMNPGTLGDSDVTPAKGPKDQTANAATMRKGNSLNHRSDGQNVLFGDGHVEFEQNPFCGVKRDNIYTVSGSDDGSKTTSDKIAGSPTWAGDSVLLPVATANPHKLTPEQEERAAVAEFRKRLPEMRQAIAAEEKKSGETAQIKQIKLRIAEMEKEAAETERRLGAEKK